MCDIFISLLSDLSTEQKEYQELARKFSREVILPQAAKYDQSGEVRTILCSNTLDLPYTVDHLPDTVDHLPDAVDHSRPS